MSNNNQLLEVINNLSPEELIGNMSDKLDFLNMYYHRLSAIYDRDTSNRHLASSLIELNAAKEHLQKSIEELVDLSYQVKDDKNR